MDPRQARSPMILLDLLGAETMFAGLVPKAGDPETWIVQFTAA